MEIIEGIYRMVQDDIGSAYWDLYRAKVITHKDGSQELGWKICNYSVPLRYGVKKIAEQQLKAVTNKEKLLAITKEYSKYKNEVFDLYKRFNMTSPDYTENLIKIQKENGNKGTSGGENNSN